jgi:hypothetical protein
MRLSRPSSQTGRSSGDAPRPQREAFIIHKTLRVTPAMEGVADHVWSLEEIARLAV